MIWIYLTGYACILGAIIMDRGTEIEQGMRLIDEYLTPIGIEVDITIHCDRTVTLSAKKRTGGLTVQHATIHSTGIIEAVWKLIKYIECSIEDWVEKELY